MDTDSSDGDSYAGSAVSVTANHESGETKLVDLINNAFDPLPLDRPIVVEMQHSGLLNADTQDILQLKRQVDAHTAAASKKILHMKALVKKIHANIEWLDTRVYNLESKLKGAVPIEYAQAESRIVFREASE